MYVLHTALGMYVYVYTAAYSIQPYYFVYIRGTKVVENGPKQRAQRGHPSTCAELDTCRARWWRWFLVFRPYLGTYVLLNRDGWH